MRLPFVLSTALLLAMACSESDEARPGAGGAGQASAGTGNRSGSPASSGSTSDAGEATAAGAPNAGSHSGGGGNGNAGSSAGTGEPQGGANAQAGETSIAGAGPGCDSFDDAFDDAALSPCWSILNGAPNMPLITTAIAGGALHLRAQGNLNGVWYQGSTKSLVYKNVSDASFRVTSLVRPRKATAATMLPTKDLHVGGLMVRSPASQGGSSENYVLFMVGHSENNNGVVHQGVEVKSTINGCSNWNEPDWGASADEQDAELRICRLGATLRFYKRVPGAGSWSAATPPSGCPGNAVAGDVLTRSDLPQTVQVGMGLNFSSPSDLSVAFDGVTLEALAADATAADCTND